LKKKINSINLDIIVNVIDELVVYQSLNRKVLFANNAACKAARKKVSDILGSYCYEIWGDSPYKVCDDCPIETVIKSNKPYSNIKIHRDGSRWFIKGYPVVDNRNEMIGVIEIASDITELLDYEQRYRTLVENINDAVVICQNSKIIYCNRKFPELLGYDYDEIKNLEFDLFDKVCQKEKSKIIREKCPSRIETVLKRKDGCDINVEASVNVVNFSGKPATLLIIRDISERKRYEEKIAEISKITHNAPISIVAFNEKFEIIYANRFFSNLYGYNTDEILGKKVFSLYGEPNPIDHFRKVIKTCKDKGVYRGYELRKRKDGSLFWVSVSVNEIRNDSGKFLFYTDNSRDYSEEKKAQDRLKESEEKYRRVVEYSHEGIVVIDDSFRITFANDTITKITGYSKSELEYADFRKFLTPDSVKIAERNYLEKINSKNFSPKHTIKVICKDGKIKVLEVSSIYFKDNDKISVVAHLLDITEKQKAEQRIKELTSQIEKFSRISADILTVGDKKELFKRMCRAIVDVSDYNRVLMYTFISEYPYIEILGYHGIKKGKVGKMLKSGLKKDDYLKLLEKGIKVGEQSCYIPHTMKDLVRKDPVDFGRIEYPRRKDGWHNKDSLLISLKNSGGEVIGIISVDDSKSGMIPNDDIVKPLEIFANHISQIIQLRKMEEEREKIHRFMAESEKMRALGEVAGGVAHDFNNLLITIIGRLQMLLNKYDDQDLVNELKIIEKAAIDGTEIVKRIQSFTKFGSKKEGTLVDITHVINDSVSFTKGKWKHEMERAGKKINIKKFYDDSFYVYGKETELREAFTNIILNAIDAMPNGGDLSIIVKPKGRYVEIEFIDTGIGMGEETLKRIYEPFFTTKGSKGTGLGMSMVYGIVKNHEGDIYVESELSKGTSIKIRLPLSSKKSANFERTGKIKGEDALLPRLNVLVVDDEDGPRGILKDILLSFGMNVKTAENGKNALDIFKNDGDIELVCTDIGMPGLSGWDIAMEMRKLKKDIKIILITGWGLEMEVKNRKKVLVNKIVSKPYDIHDIFVAIKELFPAKNGVGKN